MADNLNTIEKQPLENKDPNITFFLEDDVNVTYDNEFNIDDFMEDMTEFEDVKLDGDEDLKITQIINYTENYTVKDLLLICEYYGVAKELKTNKCSKDVIVQFLVDFESKPINIELVFKRQNLWFYMDELKKDKLMKKYVLW
jgi:hypothetical protein